MSIDHSCNGAAKGLAILTCVLSLSLIACGGGRDAPCGDFVCDPSENANSCATDCGCGNGVANPGEQCDGPDLGGGTCMDAVQRGGILRCNADCTFDTTECTLASCGNGIAEEGEACDGADLGGGTCASIGYGGGDIACTIDCDYDVSACCTDTCPTQGQAECIGDTLRECVASSAGCLAWQVTDCAASNNICESSAGAATCSCVDRCAAVGDMRCEGAMIETCAQVGECLDWTSMSDCATNGKICAAAASGPTCVLDVSAEDCSDPYPLSPGSNVVAWTALNADYLIAQPSCSTQNLDGPDLVLTYTAPEDGYVRFTLDKPSSTRWDIVVSSATCGTLAPELACTSDYAPTTLSTELAVEMGTTYYFYVRDTTNGSAPLDNPLSTTFEEARCSSLVPTATTLSPPNGSDVAVLTPVFSAELSYPIDTTQGVITVTGNMGTNLAFDLAMGPPEIALTNSGKTLVIDPGIEFPADETVTVSWSGLYDSACQVLINPPTWTVDVTGRPPCTPGMNGMVGSTITRVPTGLTSMTEYYVAADSSAAGYVYFGGLSDLYRTPKAGGTTEDVYEAASLTSNHLGYGMLVVGNEIYTLDSKTSGTSNLLWRLSTDGGATWVNQNYAQFPQTPNDDLRGITYHNGRIYMTTDNTPDTEIWSVPAGATSLPQTAVLEATLAGEYYCDGIAADDAYFYLACSTNDRLIRVNRTTLATDLLTDAIDINSTKDAVHAHDMDNDGLADALYVSSYYEEVSYVCKPSGTGPFFTGILTNFGSGSSNYGLGFDRTNNVLWMFDDDTRELVKIE